MKKWLISVPVWGDPYREIFFKIALPALKAALAGREDEAEFVFHTDKAKAFFEALDGYAVTTAATKGQSYTALQYGHQDAINRARPGQIVVLLNADIVVSVELFDSLAAHFMQGDEAVVTAGVRTVPGNDPVPIGASARELQEWAWAHRHPIIRDLEWGTGRSVIPTNLFFTQGENTVLRGFHLHPVAVLKKENLSFKSTIDGDLLEHYPRDRIHVVVHPDDLAMLEISPEGKMFPSHPTPLDPGLVAQCAAPRTSNLHRWLFTFRIGLRGDRDKVTSDRLPCIDILQKLGPGKKQFVR